MKLLFLLHLLTLFINDLFRFHALSDIQLYFILTAFKLTKDGSIEFSSDSTTVFPIAWTYIRVITVVNVHSNNTVTFSTSRFDTVTLEESTNDMLICPIHTASSPQGVKFFVNVNWNKILFWHLCKWNYTEHCLYILFLKTCIYVRNAIHFYFIIWKLSNIHPCGFFFNVNFRTLSKRCLYIWISILTSFPITHALFSKHCKK